MPSLDLPMDAPAAEALSVRPATRQDIPFIVRIEEIASTPPFPESLWAPCLRPTGTSLAAFATAMYEADASRWGGVEDFLIVERAGQALGACAVFVPDPDEPDLRTFRMERLPAVAARLGWTALQSTAFVEAYDKAWGDSGPWLQPQAPVIIECVGVVPEARGAGVGTVLMDAAFARTRALGHAAVGVSVITGNDGGRRLYDSVGFEPVVTFHPGFVDGQFPGFTKLRRRLEVVA